MKVVFDTNVLVSALVFPGGRGEEALLRVVAEQDELVLSRPILDELLGVLSRKFARDAEELSRVALLLADIGTIVKPRRRLAVLKDAADNRILECALPRRSRLDPGGLSQGRMSHCSFAVPFAGRSAMELGMLSSSETGRLTFCRCA